MAIYLFMFFFSSRRRHTRWPRDWSSDVCSSDLVLAVTLRPRRSADVQARRRTRLGIHDRRSAVSGREPGRLRPRRHTERSEERRVGKECKGRWAAAQDIKKSVAGG